MVAFDLPLENGWMNLRRFVFVHSEELPVSHLTLTSAGMEPVEHIAINYSKNISLEQDSIYLVFIHQLKN